MMSEPLNLLIALLAGLVLGGMFFGGLWWTIQKAVDSRSPAIWFLGSLLLRMSVTLAGFYLVARSQWEGLLACLLGFIVARTIVLRLTRGAARPSKLRPEVTHATQP
jgi:F1F0 ATPase subunit 2